MTTFAAEEYQSAEEVFDKEQVNEILKKLDRKVVSPDKNDESAPEDDIQKASLQSAGNYPTRKGVILVTTDAYKNLIPTGHAAIIYAPGMVVESLEGGVTVGSNNWNTVKTTCYGVTVQGTNNEQDALAANWCYKQIGKPYNWIYFNTSTRSSFYCSQLVWAAFLDNYGIDLNTEIFGSAIHPTELALSANSRIIYEK